MSEMTTQEKKQKIWLITGTSSGFGQHLVHAVLARGDKVIATARSVEHIQDIKSDDCYPLQLDVTDSLENLKARAAEAISVWGRVDVVVNNAGFGTFGSMEQSGVEGILYQYQTNVFGVIKVTNAFLPHFRERQSGTIVVIGSRSGWRTNIPFTGLYASSKAAIHAITETYAVELKTFGIRTLLVEPGGFRTKSIRVASKDEGAEPVLAPSMIAPHVDIPDYDQIKRTTIKFVAQTGGNEPGDPRKAGEVIVDVVRGEGCAVGKEFPEWLFLGEDCISDIQNKVGRILKTIDEWKEVAVSTKLDA